MSAGGAAAVFLAAFTVAVVRLGWRLGFDSVYAEDGQIFLAEDRSGQVGFPILRPYAGYAHLVPRLVAHLVDVFPAERAAVVLTVSAALVQTMAAWVGYVVVRAYRRAVAPALLIAVAVAMVPVGLEVVLNVANAQWFLLFGGIAVQFWTPRSAAARSLQVVLGVVLVLSSPFGFLVIGVVAVRAALRRTAWDIAGVLALVVAGVVQAWVMTHSGVDRIGSPSGRAAVLWGYVTRVVRDGILGVGRFGQPDRPMSATEGVLIFAAFLVLALVLVVRRGTRSLVPVLTFLALSVATFLPPVLLTQQQTADPANGGRYYVAPVLFWLVAVALVLPVTAAGDGSRWPERGALTLVCVVIAAGLISSYRVAQGYRADAPSWSAEVDRARERCSSLTSDVAVEVPIHPEGWVVRLPCRALAEPEASSDGPAQRQARGAWPSAPP